MLDADDVAEPRRLETLVGLAESSGASLVFDNLTVVRGRSVFPYVRPGVVGQLITFEQFVASHHPRSRVPNLGYLKPFVRRDVLLEADLRYREDLVIGEDSVLALELLRRRDALWCPEPLYLYWIGPASTSRLPPADSLVRFAQEMDRLCRDRAAGRPQDVAVARTLTYVARQAERARIADLMVDGRQGDALRRLVRGPSLLPEVALSVGSRLAHRAARGLRARPPGSRAERATSADRDGRARM